MYNLANNWGFRKKVRSLLFVDNFSHLIKYPTRIFQQSGKCWNPNSARNLFILMDGHVKTDVEQNEDITKKYFNKLFDQVNIANDWASLQRNTNFVSMAASWDSGSRRSGISHVFCAVRIFSKEWILNNVLVEPFNVLSKSRNAESYLFSHDQKKDLQQHDEGKVTHERILNFLNAALIVLSIIDQEGTSPWGVRI